MPIISGVLKDGAGQPIAGCTIQLKAVNTTSAVIMTTTARVGATAGEYRIEALPARYEVTLAVEDYPPQKVGIIDVYADSPDGSLNDFLTATKVEYLTPDVMNQFKLLAQQSREAADQANVASQGVSAIKDAAEKAASGAALSEKNAAGSALAARTSEINAADSVTKAAASAAAALASQNAAKLSETNAGQSASDAALRAPAPFWMSSLVGKSVMGVASYVNSDGQGYDTLNYIIYDAMYVDITLTAPFSGTVATNNPNLVVSTSDALFKDNTTAGVTYGTSITATSRQRFFIGLRFDMSKLNTARYMPDIQWQLLLNGSVVATYTSTFMAYRTFDTSTEEDW